MIKLYFFIFCFFIFSKITSQNIYGKIYQEKAVAKYIKVSNISNSSITYSDEYGNFEIKASLYDSISFTSNFYERKVIVVDTLHLKKVFVIELKEKLNELNTVVVVKEGVNIEKFNIQLKSQIKEDIKRNPHKYGVSGENLILKFISKLFRRKKTEITLSVIKYEQLNSLFENDIFFNKKLLSNELNIKEDYVHLFFDYCEAQKINAEYLNPKNDFLLFDALYKCSNSFNNLIHL